MRLEAVAILMMFLASCAAQARHTTTTDNGLEAAKNIFASITENTDGQDDNDGQRSEEEETERPTTRPPSLGRSTTKPPPIKTMTQECFTKDRELGKCVKTSMCDLEEPKIDPTTLFHYRTSAGECLFLKICCPLAKVRENPVKVEFPTPPGCGYSNPAAGLFRQSSGQYADFAEFPWMVALLTNPEVNWTSNYIGGGALIHPSVVLTAAHKVDSLEPKDLRCRAGEWETWNDNELFDHQDRDVHSIIVHEEFYRDKAFNDVALLIMAQPFKIQSNINVACLSPSLPPPGTICYSMGWGIDFNKGNEYANVLKKVNLPLMEKVECERRFRKTKLGPSYFLHRSLTCAGGYVNNDMCTGDGGSPLVCPIGNPADQRYAVVGLVAYGLDCGSPYAPGTYATVAVFYDWIDRKMGLAGIGDRPYTY